MGNYKVSEGLKPFVKRNLKKSFYSCFMYRNREGQVRCLTNAPSDTFHRVVQRAKCQKMSAEEGGLCMTSEEYNNPFMRAAILRESGRNLCCVVDDYDGLRRA